MIFKELMVKMPEVALTLSENGEYMCMLSADPNLQGPDKVTHSVRFPHGSEVAKTYRDEKGYVGCGAVTWFEFSTKGMSEEESLRFAEEAIKV